MPAARDWEDTIRAALLATGDWEELIANHVLGAVAVAAPAERQAAAGDPGPDLGGQARRTQPPDPDSVDCRIAVVGRGGAAAGRGLGAASGPGGVRGPIACGESHHDAPGGGAHPCVGAGHRGCPLALCRSADGSLRTSSGAAPTSADPPVLACDHRAMVPRMAWVSQGLPGTVRSQTV